MVARGVGQPVQSGCGHVRLIDRIGSWLFGMFGLIARRSLNVSRVRALKAVDCAKPAVVVQAGRRGALVRDDGQTGSDKMSEIRRKSGATTRICHGRERRFLLFCDTQGSELEGFGKLPERRSMVAAAAVGTTSDRNIPRDEGMPPA